MKFLFPVLKAEGLKSQINSHFGNAEAFVMVDSESRTVETIHGGVDHSHGGCQPLKLFEGRQVDGVVVGGIGAGAIQALQGAGINVYRAVEGDLEEQLDLLAKGILPLFDTANVCAEHSHSGHEGCGQH